MEVLQISPLHLFHRHLPLWNWSEMLMNTAQTRGMMSMVGQSTTSWFHSRLISWKSSTTTRNTKKTLRLYLGIKVI